MKQQEFAVGQVFESDTRYVGTQAEYHIYPQDAPHITDSWYTTGSSDNKPLYTAFLLEDLHDVTVDLGGARLIFHGRIQPFSVQRCQRVTLCNFSIDYDRPFYTQSTVVEVDPDSTDFTLEFSEQYGYRVEDAALVFCSDSWERKTNTGDMMIQCYDKSTKSLSGDFFLGVTGNEYYPPANPPMPVFPLKAIQLEGRRVKIVGAPDNFHPQVGQAVVMTHEDRRKTGILLEDCTDTVIEDVRLVHVGAMGVTASLCHNITVRRLTMYSDSEDRVVSINADGFHTFHCDGEILLEDCRFENMLDDAINVHGNYLCCEDPGDGQHLSLRNKGAGLNGMPFFRPGNTVRIFKGTTQEIRGESTVQSIVNGPEDKQAYALTLTSAIEGVQPGDVVENVRNADLTVRGCSIVCRGGFRISTAGKVLVENCTFKIHGFAVLLSGDMTYWYENTGIRDLTIRNCVCKNCEGVPVFTACEFTPTDKAPYYHYGLKLIDNTFENCKKGILHLQRVKDVLVSGNRITNCTAYPCLFEQCDNVTVRDEQGGERNGW